ncbi:calmodulin-binding protein 60 C-like isoform X1 [Salvia hispanica]|uniref:calmodulin-binding protein 60 C-like isoform X1 n=1 Tax=Salvia hispanica TaxID=49212 RepID=UPI002008EFAE|nr:calmodulin-binding protein 60 C-like isoform X1 [Salvia hispanica]XP_047982518.1 calmodulin-binding protein 60 C-like isoform X1 [Salvia hispanica]
MLIFQTGIDKKQNSLRMMSMDEVMQIVKEELESKKARIFSKVEEELESKKARIFSEVEEEIESAKRNIYSRLKSYFKHGDQTSSQSNMKLELRKRIARKILTGDEIKGEGGVPIEVALVDDVTGDVIVDEPEASSKVEFFLLKAKSDASEADDWTAEEFNATIVPQVKGKMPILAGNALLQLHRGVAVAKNISIRHHVSEIKPPEFKLGARVVGAYARIKEAKTEAFTLKNFRIKYNEKHANPSLSDKVWRLDCICRRGEIDKRLQENSICTVEDFLIQHLKNPQRLQNIVNSPNKNWQKIISNARACLTERVYCYIDPEKKKGIVFNILGDILRLFPDQTSALQSEREKADADKLLASACQNWGLVKAFNDQSSLQQHLAGLSPYIGGSSGHIHLETSYHSFDPMMSFPGYQDFFADVDEYMYETFGYGDGLMNEWNAASEVVEGGRKGWKVLLIVLKFRKRVVLDVSSIRKKQRVG